MRPVLHSLVGLCLLVAAACAGMPPSSPVGAQPLDLTIRSEPLLLKLDEPGLRKIGKLIWRGGISMTANSPNFGGWSGDLLPHQISQARPLLLRQTRKPFVQIPREHKDPNFARARRVR